MEPEKDVIQYEVADNGICTIWLNRPHVKNCVSPQLLRDLEAAVDKAAEDDSVLAVVFRGRGTTFCGPCCTKPAPRFSSRSIRRAPMTRSTT